MINKYGNQSLRYQPIFIIGSPRTGSTILYQSLTNYLDLLYIDNLACLWRKNLFFGIWLSQKTYKSQPHNNFAAEHGDSSQFGGHAPSECGGFWYRWLPKDRHFIDESDIDENIVNQISKEIIAISNYYNKPMLFKNLNAGQRLRLLKQCFPNAKFIFIRRDPRFVVFSILKAREKVKAKKSDWWSIKPQNYRSLLELPEYERCIAQVYYIEYQIKKDLMYFPTENIKEIHYRELTNQLIMQIGNWIGAHRRLGGEELPVYRKDDIRNLSRAQNPTCSAFNKYPFDKQAFE